MPILGNSTEQGTTPERRTSSQDVQTLLHYNALPSILWTWKSWGKSDRPSTYVREILSNPQDVIPFVDKFIYQIHSAGASDKLVRTTNHISCKALAEWVDLKDLLAKIQATTASGPDSKNGTRQFAIEKLTEFVESGMTPEQFDARKYVE